MNNIYDGPAYADIQAELHEKLADLRAGYGGSDELDQRYLKDYLDHRNKRKNN